MRFRLGILVCLLAGCVSQPTSSTPRTSVTPPLARIDGTHVLRIGVEFLPPDERLPAAERVRAEPLNEPTKNATGPVFRSSALRAEEPSLAPQLTGIDLDKIDDPIARETMHFVTDLVAADRQRVRREIGIPFFDFRQIDAERGPLLNSEVRLQEDHERWVQQRGTRLLQRPLRQLLRRLPIVSEIEIAVQDFRSDHVPLTEPYQKQHGDRRKLGRMSMRIHTRDLKDPVEVVYINSGVRIGTSQGRGKLSINYDISESLQVSFRARTNYTNGEYDLRTDLVYRPSSHMSVHLALGDDMDFLSTSSIYSLFESPMDGSPGMVLYAVHTF